MTQDEFTALVKETRRRTGLSGPVLGSRIGVSFMTIHRWEKGRTMPKDDAVAYWAAALRAVEPANV
ncbi:helix-turn-helix domain-containing protein [Hymenobacter sp. HSC-4F20]|uniref:helix-turn-helix domain-containing protein n=1 Tax=Hymenobacter sp. HSC-4F20 TaxID=2864135 RepID=UPI001C730AD9|nr:helix-turn-helix transcriptional regulator [Hymenobacter sp. HSC-4F20]MBX0289699.1 helix-turn-helix domain-containing protein [Hymenobacter sp. HSC-4F20]